VWENIEGKFLVKFYRRSKDLSRRGKERVREKEIRRAGI